MATNIEQILGRDINSLKELREEIKRLQDSIASVDPTTQQFKDTAEKLAAAQEQLTTVTRAGKDGMDVAKDSIVGMEREYRNLYNTYKTLTEEQRNSDFGREMAASLETLSNKLNETKKGVGNFKDNIGRYSESVIDAFTKMGGSVGGMIGPFAQATKGVMGFNAALKANPVGAVITLIMTLVNLIKSLTQSIKGNEESQMRLNQAMASFQPIIDAASNAMDKFGQAIVKVIEWIAGVIDKLRLAKAAFTDFIGITKGAKKDMEAQQKTYKDLAASVNNLTKTKREYQKLNAADEAEVQRLREEASEVENVQQKRELLQQAKELQAEIDARNIEVAKEELRILEEQAKLTANDAAMNDKLAAAVAKVSQAEAQAAQNMRNFNKQLGSGTSSAAGTATSALKNYREEAKKLYEDLVEESKDEITKLTEKYQKEKKLLEKYHLDTRLLTEKYESDMQALNKKTYEKSAETRLTFIRDTQRRIELAKQQYSGEDLLSIELDDAKFKIKILENFLDEAARLHDEWLENEVYGFVTITNDSVHVVAGEMTKEVQKQAEKTFADLFKEGSNFENFEGTLARIRDIFKEASEYVGDNVESLDQLNIHINILTERVKSLNDELIQERVGVRLNENLLNYYEAMTDVLTGATLSAEEYNKKTAELGYTELETRKNILAEELENFSGSTTLKLELTQQYYDALAELRQRDAELAALDLERTTQVFESALDLQASIGPTLSSIGSMIENNINAKVKEGKITEEQANKQKKALIGLEKVTMAVNIASVAAQTAAGIMGVWKAYGLERAVNAETAAATGPAAAATLALLNAKSLASAIIQTASLAAQGTAQIASIRAGSISKISSLSDTGDGGGAAGTVATPAEIDSTPYTFTRTLQTAEEEDELNRPIYVSVTDINDAQNRVRVRDNESSF